MRRCDGWGNKDNGGNSEAASLGAAPFLKKALWVLRHLVDQDSATQPLSPNVSEVTAVCCLVSDRVINGIYPFKLMLAASCSTAECSSLLGVPQSWSAQSIMVFTLRITAHMYFLVTSLQHAFHNSHRWDPPHVLLHASFYPQITSRGEKWRGLWLFQRAHGSRPESD